MGEPRRHRVLKYSLATDEIAMRILKWCKKAFILKTLKNLPKVTKPGAEKKEITKRFRCSLDDDIKILMMCKLWARERGLKRHRCEVASVFIKDLNCEKYQMHKDYVN